MKSVRQEEFLKFLIECQGTKIKSQKAEIYRLKELLKISKPEIAIETHKCLKCGVWTNYPGSLCEECYIRETGGEK